MFRGPGMSFAVISTLKSLGTCHFQKGPSRLLLVLKFVSLCSWTPYKQDYSNVEVEYLAFSPKTEA